MSALGSQPKFRNQPGMDAISGGSGAARSHDWPDRWSRRSPCARDHDVPLVLAEVRPVGAFDGTPCTARFALVPAHEQALGACPVRHAFEDAYFSTGRLKVGDFLPLSAGVGGTEMPFSFFLGGDEYQRLGATDATTTRPLPRNCQFRPRSCWCRSLRPTRAAGAKMSFGSSAVQSTEPSPTRGPLRAIPGLAAVEGVAAGAIEHEAGQALAAGIEVQRKARLAASADLAAVDRANVAPRSVLFQMP